MSIISFKGVTKRFSDGTEVFSSLSFNLEEGETVLITGPSGSGKTTIMKLLIAEYKPTEGEIFFDRKAVHKIRSRALPKYRRKIGVVFQDYKLIEELNVWENVALPLCLKGAKKSQIEERVTDLLKLIELTDKALVFPKQLSGGEAQRISIARALANSPQVIFADEPTGNLDQKNSQRILRLLTKINQLGTTLLLATHDPFLIENVIAKRIDLSIFGDDEQDELAKAKEKKSHPSSQQNSKSNISKDSFSKSSNDIDNKKKPKGGKPIRLELDEDVKKDVKKDAANNSKKKKLLKKKKQKSEQLSKKDKDKISGKNDKSDEEVVNKKAYSRFIKKVQSLARKIRGVFAKKEDDDQNEE